MRSPRALELRLFACAALVTASMAASAEQEAAATPVYSVEDLGQPMSRWLLLGPIPADPGLGPGNMERLAEATARDYLEAAGGEAQHQPEAGSTIRYGEIELRWRPFATDRETIDLAEALGARESSVAYAAAVIEADEQTSLLLGVGSDDAVKIWLNGEPVHENVVGRPVRPGDDVVHAPLRAGRNLLLLKVVNGPAAWGFSCSRLDEDTLGERLRVAAARGNVETINLLVDHGADPDAKSVAGSTPLHIARRKGRAEAVRALLERGADAGLPAPPPGAVVDATLEGIVDADAPGVAVLVARDGSIVYARGIGRASLAHGVPVSPETTFRIGSITKQFTAAAILKLQEQGKLSVADPLSKFFPDYPRGDEVTLAHLLTHTSGIHSYTDDPGFFETVTLSVEPDELISSFRDDPFDFDPGSGWHYSNSGYFLLGRIVEKVSGSSYEDYLKESFFEKLGMRSTGVHSATRVIEHEATGYAYEAGEYVKAIDWNMSRAGGAGALYSTVGDLYRWNEGVFGGKVLSEESLAAAFTPVEVGEDGAGDAELAMLGGGYGYGWFVSEFRGQPVIEHGGGLHGFASHLARYPELDTTIAVLSNATPAAPELVPSQLARDIAEIHLWPDLEERSALLAATGIDPAVFDEYTGQYDLLVAICTITREEDRLFSQISGQPRLELHPRSETEFFLREADVTFTFQREGDGPAQELTVVDRGRTFKARRIEPRIESEIDPETLDDYTGRYDYGADRVLLVMRDGDRLLAQLTGQPKLEIAPSGPDEFFWKLVNARITFVRDESGKVVGAVHRQGGATIEAEKLPE